MSSTTSSALSRVYWQSCIGCVNWKLVPHFLRHYLDVHRLDPARARIVVHSDAESVQYRPAVLRALADRHLPPPLLWHGNDFDVMIKGQRLAAAAHDVPPEVWLLTADVDELLDPEFNIEEAIATCEHTGAAYVRAVMVDRLAPQGTLRDVAPEGDLFAQFPEEATLTAQIAGGWVFKVVLRRAWVELANGAAHQTVDPALPVYHEFPSLYHFKWDAEVVPRLRRRARDFAAKGLRWWEQSHRLANFLEGVEREPPPFVESPKPRRKEDEEVIYQQARTQAETVMHQLAQARQGLGRLAVGRTVVEEQRRRLEQADQAWRKKDSRKAVERLRANVEQARMVLQRGRRRSWGRLVVRSAWLREVEKLEKRVARMEKLTAAGGPRDAASAAAP